RRAGGERNADHVDVPRAQRRVVALLIRNLSQIATPTAVRGRELRVHEKAVIVIDDGRFAYIGPESDKPSHLFIDEDFDARGATPPPGPLHPPAPIASAGFRGGDFTGRPPGEPSEQIAPPGGGIPARVRAPRPAPEPELIANIEGRANVMAHNDTTTA